VQIAALREIADRTEGKARQSIEVDADFNSTLASGLPRVASGCCKNRDVFAAKGTLLSVRCRRHTLSGEAKCAPSRDGFSRRLSNLESLLSRLALGSG
jgi:hypothetical protein